METLQIRSFRTDDLDAVRQLWRQFPGDRFATQPDDVMIAKQLLSDELFFVAELQQQVVAVAIAGYDGASGTIEALAVDPDRQRQGIGRKLTTHIEGVLRLRGCSQIELYAAPDQTEVAAFLSQLGYDPDSRQAFRKSLGGQPATTDPAPTILIDEELSLSAMRDEDKPALLQGINSLGDAAAYLTRIPNPYAAFDADFWLASCRVQTTAPGGIPMWRMRNWAIRDAQHRLIGGIGLSSLTLGEKAEIGYWLASERWGQGIMTKVVRGLTEFAFREYRLQRIFAEVMTTNVASRRVMEKAGYELEGVLRRHSHRDGQPSDAAIYGQIARPIGE